MTIKRGDVDAAFKSAKNILEGTFINGGQDHFYLESQAALAVPGEFDQLTVHSSTQNPSEVQDVIAHLLGLPINKVTVVTKRMGGGFGGKECQATHPAAIAALVAHKLKRPARIAYNKDDDMCVTGGRHPFQNDYKVAFDDDGVITAAQIDFFSDGGAFADLSTSVLGRALTHADNAYYLPNALIRGTVCRHELSAEHRLPRLRRAAGNRHDREHPRRDRGPAEDRSAGSAPAQLLRHRRSQHHAVRAGGPQQSSAAAVR